MNHFLPGLLVGLLGSLLVAAGLAGVILSRLRQVRRRMRKNLGAGSCRFAPPPARLRVVQRLAELGTLTGGLAHEIKNPLSTVLLNLQLSGRPRSG